MPPRPWIAAATATSALSSTMIAAVVSATKPMAIGAGHPPRRTASGSPVAARRSSSTAAASSSTPASSVAHRCTRTRFHAAMPTRAAVMGIRTGRTTSS